MIKMIATDIDGTIFNMETAKFSDNVKNCIKNLTDAGIKIVLITGRMHKSTFFLADELGLDTPIVSYQGGLIKENKINGKTLYQKNLDTQKAKEIIHWAKDNNIHINLYMDDVLYVEKDDEIAKRYTYLRNVDYKVVNFDNLDIKNVNKLLAIDYDNPDNSTKWRDYLSNKYPELAIVKSSPYFCEISDIGAKKSCAVEFLRKYWNFKQDEVLTIGDQDNDIELLKSGGIKVAMGNATEKLKQYADYITDTIDNDGFVKAAEKFVLINNKEVNNV